MFKIISFLFVPILRLIGKGYWWYKFEVFLIDIGIHPFFYKKHIFGVPAGGDPATATYGLLSTLGGGLARASQANSAAKSAASAAQQQQRLFEQAAAPSQELQKLQTELFRDITKPLSQSELDLYNTVTKPQAQAEFQDYMNITRPFQKKQSELFTDLGVPLLESQFQDYMNLERPLEQEQRNLVSDIFLPSTRSLGGKLASDLTSPFQFPQEDFNRAFQSAKTRTMEGFEPARRNLSNQLAARGVTSEMSGAAGKEFRDIDIQQARSIEQVAVEQALQEFNYTQQSKQQSIENMFRFLGRQPSFGSPSLPGFTPPGAPSGLALPNPSTGNVWYNYPSNYGAPQPTGRADYSGIFGGSGGDDNTQLIQMLAGLFGGGGGGGMVVGAPVWT